MNNESTSQSERSGFDREESVILPLESAKDVGRSQYARVQFDQHISDILAEHARGRAPSKSNVPHKTFRDHLLGIASEVAVATWRRGTIDRRILPDYSGDGGVDVVAPSKWGTQKDRFQVKATRDVTAPERLVRRDRADDADYFVLCCTNAPRQFVEIVGYLPSPLLRLIGPAYGFDGYRLAPENLYPIKPALYGPDDVREVMYG